MAELIPPGGRRHPRGQAIVETAIMLPLMIFVVFLGVYFSVTSVQSERIVGGARYAAFVSRMKHSYAPSLAGGGYMLGAAAPQPTGAPGAPDQQFTILQVYFHNAGWSATATGPAVRCDSSAATDFSNAIEHNLAIPGVPAPPVPPLWATTVGAQKSWNGIACYDDVANFFEQPYYQFQPELAVGMRVFNPLSTSLVLGPSQLSAEILAFAALASGTAPSGTTTIAGTTAQNIVVAEPLSPQQIVAGANAWPNAGSGISVGTGTYKTKIEPNSVLGNYCVNVDVTNSLRGPYIGTSQPYQNCAPDPSWPRTVDIEPSATPPAPTPPPNNTPPPRTTPAPAPTGKPTTAPTAHPTSQPTSQPTSGPTSQPTPQPAPPATSTPSKSGCGNGGGLNP